MFLSSYLRHSSALCLKGYQGVHLAYSICPFLVVLASRFFLSVFLFYMSSLLFACRLMISWYWDGPHTVVCFRVWPFRRLTKFPCALFQVYNWRAPHPSSVNIKPSFVLQHFPATADAISVVSVLKRGVVVSVRLPVDRSSSLALARSSGYCSCWLLVAIDRFLVKGLLGNCTTVAVLSQQSPVSPGCPPLYSRLPPGLSRVSLQCSC